MLRGRQVDSSGDCSVPARGWPPAAASVWWGVVKPLASRAGVASSSSRPYPGIRLSGSFDCAALVFSSFVWSVLVFLGDSARHPLFFGILLDLLYLVGWMWGGCFAGRVVVVVFWVVGHLVWGLFFVVSFLFFLFSFFLFVALLLFFTTKSV